MEILSARAVLDGLRLVDHHCHGVTGAELARPDFERLLTEAHDPASAGGSTFDTLLGLAVRRWCAPVLDLPPHPLPEDYLTRRAELGAGEANRRLLHAAGVADLLVDDGYQPAEPLPAQALTAASGARVRRVLRLEALAEQVAADGVAAADFARTFADRLADQAATAVGLKSVVAYRASLDLDPAPPRPAEVTAAAGSWLARCERLGRYRVTDPVLLRHLLRAGAELAMPLQLHTGFGDPDLRLHRSDPALLTDFCAGIAGTGTTVLLLHCYPYHRQAAFLASVYPHVYCDIGLALNYVGARAAAVLAETLELAPFGKLLYSSDAFGLAELHLLGAVQLRRALGSVLDGWVADGDIAAADAARYAQMIGAGNAQRVYRLDPPPAA
ncbi:MAG TPA: amidohydrolase family protein [Mycobacteriales bacterium]|nr:amidohydrolase family protein [Mycobacteriales bacterium]